MQIAHLWPCRDSSKNIGDHFVQLGIRRLIHEQIEGATYTDLPVRSFQDHDAPYGITRASVDVINQHDLLVIGGSNLYEPDADGWGVAAEDDAIRAVTCPVLLIGIGTGWSFAFPRFPDLSASAANQLVMLHEKAVGSSVRDSMTERLLRRLGVTSAVTTGCPAMYLGRSPLRPAAGQVVGVPFLPRRMHPRPIRSFRTFRSETERRRRLAWRLFSGLIERMHAKGMTPKIIVQDSDDLEFAHRDYGADVVYSDHASQILKEIESCDVVVGFRLHACIAALGFGIPVVPVLLDGRCHAFAETLNLTEFSVPLDPGAVSIAMDRIEMAVGERRSYWSETIRRRDALAATMQLFVKTALAGARLQPSGVGAAAGGY